MHVLLTGAITSSQLYDFILPVAPGSVVGVLQGPAKARFTLVKAWEVIGRARMGVRGTQPI